MSALEVVQAHYAASERGDLDGMLAPLAPDARWTEAAGSTYAGTYFGVDAIRENVFHRIGAEWVSFSANVSEVLDAGDTVVALGDYVGVHRTTGKAMTARFTHVWRVADGRVTSFEQVADTALIRAAES
ncbi:nuclear transport factor 2 family protein [Saccharothrix sp. NPDC042600]|uniref:nuclear transport factor 2 family protein n=1 Tax=Saccharothrix TaxID=2071 RepID=UPI0033D3701D|nr:nuclear transport factor 2 family protein [Saccharothrix mutabilis subsp. capreolus]